MDKILIVDDEVEVAQFLSNFLRRKGIKTFPATTVKEAIDIFLRERPNLVFLDIRMQTPDDGFIILEKIREVASEEEVKVVMLTAREDRASIMKAKKLGAQDYLVKPIDLMTFDKLVFQYLKESHS
ncbi:MAG: hypothetical protein B6D55_03995 [Candidatus Omnitrophica bacterium 4484_70.2]|nr:MAG: hypothetical protein B6D55_03995 [Candidatus Omnitrophica bacterium 4484_70.2]